MKAPPSSLSLTAERLCYLLFVLLSLRHRGQLQEPGLDLQAH